MQQSFPDKQNNPIYKTKVHSKKISLYYTTPKTTFLNKTQTGKHVTQMSYLWCSGSQNIPVLARQQQLSQGKSWLWRREQEP